MSEYMDKIRAKILDHLDYIEANSLGHKFGTMHYNGIFQRVCVNCGCAINAAKARKPCEGNNE